jgi:hypothetical protein|tara:strand:+ start:155 stop:277 length:123 start_codon:yes stop_codon:yes gene_type:complete
MDGGTDRGTLGDTLGGTFILKVLIYKDFILTSMYKGVNGG